MNEDGAKGQLRRGERESLARERLGDAIHLEDDLAGLDFADEVLGIALAIAHADLGGLLRDRLVGKDANPDPAAALDVARQGAARGFELAGGQAAARRGLQPVLAERHLVAARGDAGVAALLLLAVLGSGGLQHCYSFDSPLGSGLASPSGFSSFFAFLMVVFGAGAPSFFGAAARGREGARLAPALGAGLLARLGSAGASGCGAGTAAAPGSAAC